MDEKIELRSEKVRRVVGKMPLSLIRASTITLAVLYALLVGAGLWWLLLR